MDFLGIGPLEIVLVVLLALVLFGPKDIARSARDAGRTLNRLYKSEAWRSMNQASRALRGLPNRLAREAEFEELERVGRDLDPSKPRPPAAPMLPPSAGVDDSTGMAAWRPSRKEPPDPTGG